MTFKKRQSIHAQRHVNRHVEKQQKNQYYKKTQTVNHTKDEQNNNFSTLTFLLLT
jgi:hypothetical protein